MRTITKKLGSPPPLPAPKKNPNLSEITLKNITVATPMTGGGVESGTIDLQRPVRIPSIRGHLRYWWRMMHLGTVDLSEREAAI